VVVPSVRYEDLPHERPELEALLPDSLAGCPLLEDSVAGEFAIAGEDLYLGSFPAAVDELVPAERRDDGVFFSGQLGRLWLVTGFCEREGDSVRLYGVGAEGEAFWNRVVARLEVGLSV
jgi:hypothetical protein